MRENLHVCALTCWHTTVGVWIPGFPSAPLAFTPAERHRGQTATSHVSSQAHHGAIRTGDSSKPRHWGHAGNARKPQGTGARPCRVAGNARKPRHRAMGGGHERTPIQMKSACSVISIWLRYCREKAEKRACAATGLTDDWVPSVAAGDAAHQSDELLAALLAHPVPTMQRTLYTLPTRALRCCPLFNLSASLLDSVALRRSYAWVSVPHCKQRAPQPVAPPRHRPGPCAESGRRACDHSPRVANVVRL